MMMWCSKRLGLSVGTVILALSSWWWSALDTPMASAAVTFDATFEGETSSHASPFSCTSGSSCHVTASVGANANRQLYCILASSDNLATTGTVTMTWDSGGTNQTMTTLTSVNSVGGTVRSIYLAALLAPVTGSKTISAAWTGTHSTSTYLGCISVYNADQITGWRNIGTDTGSSTSPSSTVTTASGNMAIVGHSDDTASSVTINTGSSGWIDVCCASNAAQGYLASVSGSSVISWTLGSSSPWAHVKVDAMQFSAHGSPIIFP